MMMISIFTSAPAPHKTTSWQDCHVLFFDTFQLQSPDPTAIHILRAFTSARRGTHVFFNTIHHSSTQRVIRIVESTFCSMPKLFSTTNSSCRCLVLLGPFGIRSDNSHVCGIGHISYDGEQDPGTHSLESFGFWTHT